MTEPEERQLPIVRYAPIGEIVLYEVSEDELTRLSRGSTGALSLYAASLFFGAFASFLSALLASPPPAGTSKFTVFVVLTVGFGLTFLVMLLQGFAHVRESNQLISVIRERSKKRSEDKTSQKK